MDDSASAGLTSADIALLIDMLDVATSAVNTATSLIPNSPAALEAISASVDSIADPIVSFIHDVICDV